jgi:hypothetical protein
MKGYTPMTSKEEEHSHSPECPIFCLEGLLSPNAYVPLARDPGLKTIKDVITLHQNGELRRIRNIGELRFKEIEAVLGSINRDTESGTQLPDLYLLLKLQTTSDIPVPENPMFDVVRESVSHLLEDLYIDTDDGATLHIGIAGQWWLTERSFAHWQN